jgi:hypothetical protein
MQKNWSRAKGISLSVWLTLLLSVGSGMVAAQTVFEIEPGLKIPNAKTPWAIDTFENQRELVPIHHSTITVNKHTASNLAGSVAGSVFYKPKLTTELNGLNSRNQLHSNKPVLYFLVEDDQDSGGQGKSTDTNDFVIARVEQIKAKDKRVIDQLAITQLTGHAKRREDFVVTEITQMQDGWLRIEPKAPMPEGEYVLLPIPKMNGTYSTTVWDFGINSKAPNAKDAIPAAKQ